MRRSLNAVLIVTVVLLVSVSSARANTSTPELMNFNYLPNLQSVGSFYDGSGGNGIPNYGVSFSNFWGLRSGNGSFSADPTKTPIVFINTLATGNAGPSVTGTMTVGPGFSNGLNFLFSADFGSNQSELITIWSGANGTGTVLATLRLYTNDSGCNYCLWTAASTSFSGTAHSVTFSGPADEMGITDITLGSTRTAIPEPSPLYLLGTGLAAVSAGKLRRFLGL